MTFAHLSDTHLGFRAYGRTTPQGYDQREVDVFQTFKKILNAIQERDPDIVVHAGDLFHVVRPSNDTIVRTFKALTEFQVQRRGKPFILIGGNHDSPRQADAGNILRLFDAIPGLIVKTGKAEAIDLPDLNLELLCVPSNSLYNHENIEYAPQFKRAYSLLTMHGLAKQALPDKHDFDVEETHADRWTYVALGDFHVHQTYGRNIAYAGSTDFTSTNIWEELTHRKGWVWYDTELAHLEFIPVETRKVLDLDRIDARNLDGEGIGEALQSNAKWDAGDQPIVRQLVQNVHPETRARVPQSVIRELSAKALYYRPDFRLLSSLPASVTEKTPGESLDASWEGHIAGAVLPFGMDRDEVTNLGKNLLREVREREADPATA